MADGAPSDKSPPAVHRARRKPHDLAAEERLLALIRTLPKYLTRGWAGVRYQLDYHAFEAREDSLCELIQLQCAFPRLSAEDQSLIVWLGIRQDTEPEIAARLGISQQAVSLRLRRLVRRIHEA
jgi:DNA-directed RNA polymerase specialized sigma24 family protein